MDLASWGYEIPYLWLEPVKTTSLAVSRLQAYIAQSQVRESVPGLLDLSSGQSQIPVNFDLAISLRDLQYYPPRCYGALTELYAEGIRVLRPRELPDATLFNGAKEAVYSSLKYFRSEESRKRIWIPRTTWSAYSLMAELLGLKIIYYEPAELRERLCAERDLVADILLLGNPNNPTGSAPNLEDIETILKASSLGLAVVSDETYGFFDSFRSSLLGHIKAHPKVLVVDAISKCLGCPGVRLGYLFGERSIIKEIEMSRAAVQSGVSSLALVTAGHLIGVGHHLKLREAVLRNRVLLLNFVKPFGGISQTGGMYVYHRFNSTSDRIASESSILGLSGVHFGASELYTRYNTCCPTIALSTN